eukprot:2667925-Rhodomonas_salina.4
MKDLTQAILVPEIAWNDAGDATGTAHPICEQQSGDGHSTGTASHNVSTRKRMDFAKGARRIYLRCAVVNASPRELVDTSAMSALNMRNGDIRHCIPHSTLVPVALGRHVPRSRKIA